LKVGDALRPTPCRPQPLCYDAVPMALTFDTRKAFQKLRQRGLSEPAADGIVEVVEEATNVVVTADILHAEVAALRGEMRAEMAEMRADMWRALYTAVGAIVGVVIAVAAVSLTVASLIN